MKRTARLAILGIALIAGLLAAFLVARSPGPQAPVVQASAPSPDSVDVLVAAGDLAVGTTLRAENVAWRGWPANSKSPHLILRSAQPNARDEFNNAIVRIAFLDGEPMRSDKVIKPNGPAGFMSAILPTGMRAVAISIDSAGVKSAGGFILPNDRVDIIRTTRNEDSSKSGVDAYDSQTILTNVRVLAIGQEVTENPESRAVTGKASVTLELDAMQTETIALAQKQGELTLALRSMVDRQEPPGAQLKDGAMTIVRFGVSTQSGK